MFNSYKEQTGFNSNDGASNAGYFDNPVCV